MRYLTAAFACLFSLSAFASPPKALVYLDLSSRDPIGDDLAFKVKETILKSASMDLVNNAFQAPLAIYLTTIKMDMGPMIGYAIVRVGMPGFIYEGTTMGYCGQAVTSQCADTIVATIAKMASEH